MKKVRRTMVAATVAVLALFPVASSSPALACAPDEGSPCSCPKDVEFKDIKILDFHCPW